MNVIQFADDNVKLNEKGKPWSWSKYQREVLTLEQALSRVFATCVKLIQYNPQLTASAKVLSNEIRFTNGSVIRAVSSDYKGQAGGRQKLAIFDELWCYDSERATRLFEEMTPPPTEPGAYLAHRFLCRVYWRG